MVPNVIAAPQHHIISERDEWLHSIIFKYEDMFAEFHVPPHERFRTHITRKSITLGFRISCKSRPEPVQLCVNNST